MSILAVPIGCGADICEARIVAWLYGPDDAGRADPWPACVAAVNLSMEHWRDDKARMLRSASAALTSGRW